MSVGTLSPAGATGPGGIALVDDHQLVGLALRTAFGSNPRLQLVGVHPTVDALLGAGTSPALVLLDLRLADGSSPASNVARIRATGAGVLAFSSGEDAHLVREALRADVLGLLRKSAPVPVITYAVERAVLGMPVVSSEWAHAVESDPLIADAHLSPREAEVLQLFADGAKSQTVAEELHITVATLEDYVRRIRTKYARIGRPAPTKIDLYKRAVEDGLLPAPGRE